MARRRSREHPECDLRCQRRTHCDAWRAFRVGGASIDPRVVLIGGLSAMVASAVSMAGGAYLATKSQREVFEGQLAREAAEIEAMPELERQELVDIYRSKASPPKRRRRSWIASPRTRTCGWRRKHAKSSAWTSRSSRIRCVRGSSRESRP